MGQIRGFKFHGQISSSKSLMNRALIVQSQYKNLEIIGESQCDDVIKMQEALLNFELGEPMDCGATGTTLRFLMARVSRCEGEFYLFGDERLFNRPHQPLIKLLNQFGVQIDFPEKNYIRVVSKGWKIPKVLEIDFSQSSQFASALLLNAWDLEEDLILNMSEDKKSFSYLMMTVDFLKALGMEIILQGNQLKVPAGQKLKLTKIQIEPDMSSCFAVAAFGATLGEVKLHSFPEASIQPDFKFIEILKEMNVAVEYSRNEKTLSILKSDELRPIDIDLSDNPDLFPVLSVLLTQANGLSEITGIDHLIYKESDRIQNTMELIQSVGGQCRYEHHKFYIQGNPKKKFNQSVEFNPDQDHRMAMAASLFKALGAGIDISDTSVVNKSFPEFWQVVGQS